MSEFKLHEYLHVSNSGAHFQIEQGEYGCRLTISTGAFSNLQQVTKIDMTGEAVKCLAAMFAEASKHSFYEDDCASLARPSSGQPQMAEYQG